MTSLLRLFKVVYRLNNSSKILLNKNLGNSSALDGLHLQSVFISEHAKKYASLDNSKFEKQTDHENLFEQKIAELNKEIFFHGIITKFNIDDLLEDIKQSGTISNLQGLFLLRCCTELISDKSPMLRKQLGDEIWKTLSEVGVTLDVSHYNALLDIYLECEFDFSPFDFLKIMSDANVEPNRVTFQKLISQFCQQGKVEEAMKIVDTLANEQLTLNENVYSSFIHGHLLNGNLEAAHEVLSSMESDGIPITIKTHSEFLYHYAKKGDIYRVKNILKECTEKEVYIPDKVILTTVFNFSANGFTELIDEILSMTSGGLSYIKEANKMIYKLIENHQEDVAFKVFQTLPKNDYNSTKRGNFFLQALINCNTPIDKIIEFYRFLKKDGIINPQSIVFAIHKSFANDMYETSMTLMKTWKEIEGTIREHYFYRILKAYGEDGRTDDILKVIERMVLEFNINPSIFTLRNYVLPYMEGQPEDLLFPLVYHLVNIETASNAILLKLLSENKMRDAVRFMSINFYLPFKMPNFQNSLIQAYKNTEDTPSFIWILHYLHKKWLEKESSSDSSQRLVDSCVLEAIKFLSPDNKYLIQMLFKGLVEKGLSLSPEITENIESVLGNEIMPQVSNSLKLLKSGNLEPKPVLTENFSKKLLKNVEKIEKLENVVKVLSNVNDTSTSYLKKILLQYYCRSSNEVKARELLLELESKDKSLSYSVYYRLIGMYLHLGKIDEAEIWLEKSKENSEFQLKRRLILKWATVLVNRNEIEKAQNCLAWKTYEIPPTNQDINDLLTAVAKRDDEDLLDKFYNILETNGYMDNIDFKKSHLLKHYVLLHLNRGDNEAAVKKYEWLYEKYKQSPCSLLLLRKFVNNGDEKLLERVKKICFKVYGEVATYVDLAMINLENGDLDVAENIFKKHCPSLYEKKVFYYADMYYRKQEINKLERLFYILNNLKYDVEKLSVLLLKIYSIKNKWKEGYELWIKMQNSDMVPSKNFLNCFNLIMNNEESSNSKYLDEFNTAVDNLDLDSAENVLESLPLLHKNDCYSQICQIYARINRISDAVKFWKDLKVRFNLDLNTLAAEVILTKVLEKNDIENIEKIDSFLDPTFKKESFFSTFLNRVYLQAGAWNLFLKNLEFKLDDGTLNSRNMSLYVNNRIVLDSLMKHPELCNQFEKLAFKFSDKNIFEPLVVLWSYYFLNKNPKADELWNDFLKYRQTVSCKELFYFSRDKNDPDLYLKLMSTVMESFINRNAKLTIYSQVLRNCMKSSHPERYECALKCLQYGLLDFSMEEFDLDLLVTLQAGLESSGISWPWLSKPVEV